MGTLNTLQVWSGPSVVSIYVFLFFCIEIVSIPGSDTRTFDYSRTFEGTPTCILIFRNIHTSTSTVSFVVNGVNVTKDSLNCIMWLNIFCSFVVARNCPCTCSNTTVA